MGLLDQLVIPPGGYGSQFAQRYRKDGTPDNRDFWDIPLEPPPRIRASQDVPLWGGQGATIPVDFDFEPSPVYDLPPHVTSFLDRAAKGTNMNNRIGQYTDMALSGMSVKDIADQDEQDQLQRKAVDIARQTMDLSDEEFENAMRQYEQAALSVPNPPQYGNAEPDMFDQLGSVLGMALDRGHATAYPRLAKAAAKERADEKYRREMEGYKGQMQGYEARVAAGKFEADRAGRRRDRSETDYLRELGKQDAREAAKQMKADESDRMMAALKLRLEETARQKELDRELKRQGWGFQYQKQFVLDRAKYIQESTMPQPEKQAALAKLAREYDPDVFEEPEVKAVLGTQTYQQANMAAGTENKRLQNRKLGIDLEYERRLKELEVQGKREAVAFLKVKREQYPQYLAALAGSRAIRDFSALAGVNNQTFDNMARAWEMTTGKEIADLKDQKAAKSKELAELDKQMAVETNIEKLGELTVKRRDLALDIDDIEKEIKAKQASVPVPPMPDTSAISRPNAPMQVDFSGGQAVVIPPDIKAEADRRAGRNTKQKTKPQPRQQAKTPAKGATTFQGRVDGANVKVTVRKKQ